MTILPTQGLAAWFDALNSVTCRARSRMGGPCDRRCRRPGSASRIFARGAPPGAIRKDIRDGFDGRRSHLSEFYIASRLSLNSLPLSFEKISCFVQLPDKLFDLR